MKLVEGKTVSDTKLEKPFRIIIGGGSGCEKTHLLKKLVDRNHFSSPFDKIVYIYPSYLDDIPVEFDPIVEYQPGLNDIQYFTSLPKNTLLLFDDMMSECGGSNDIMKLFSVIARKKNISIIFLVQNIYDQTKQLRNIRLNATGFFIFKFYSANDVNFRLLRDLGLNHIMPKHLMESIYSKNFEYIYIDVHPERHSQFGCLKGNIFDKYFTIYNQMSYIAISRADFLKYFKVLEEKKGTVKAIKNEIEIRKKSRQPKKKSRKRFKTSSSSEEIESSEENKSTGSE